MHVQSKKDLHIELFIKHPFEKAIQNAVLREVEGLGQGEAFSKQSEGMNVIQLYML